MNNENNAEKRWAVLFYLTHMEAAKLRQYTKVESLGPAARMLVLKTLESHQLAQSQPAK